MFYRAGLCPMRRRIRAISRHQRREAEARRSKALSRMQATPASDSSAQARCASAVDEELRGVWTSISGQARHRREDAFALRPALLFGLFSIRRSQHVKTPTGDAFVPTGGDDPVVRFRRDLKVRAITFRGAICVGCSRDGPNAVFEFHHRDAATKEFGIGDEGVPRSWQRIVAELAKCVMLCANCHREVHAGVRTLDGLSQLAEEALKYAA